MPAPVLIFKITLYPAVVQRLELLETLHHFFTQVMDTDPIEQLKGIIVKRAGFESATQLAQFIRPSDHSHRLTAWTGQAPLDTQEPKTQSQPNSLFRIAQWHIHLATIIPCLVKLVLATFDRRLIHPSPKSESRVASATSG